MLEFIPANELKKNYEAYGHFYTIKLKNKELIDCRSVLEIIEKKTTPTNIQLLSEEEPNAIFIMMNPGSSVPLEKIDNIILDKNIDKLKVVLVPTKPDITQYQVMRVMHYCGWSHVRILNISDMREPLSNIFTERFIDIENRTAFIDHSVFSEKRDNELKTKLIKNRSILIVCAWGVSTDLNPLIDRCLKKIDTSFNILGLLKENTTNKYFHPLPTLQKDKILWIENIVKKIKTSYYLK